jgi:hypothetical protein
MLYLPTAFMRLGRPTSTESRDGIRRHHSIGVPGFNMEPCTPCGGHCLSGRRVVSESPDLRHLCHPYVEEATLAQLYRN